MSKLGRRLIQWSLGTFALAGGAGYSILVLQHNRGMVPTNAKYETKKKPLTREQSIEKMKNEVFDLVIIGGGATGTGVAMDAASRGLKCALVEHDDFASGTSSRSTKLIHGGVRYLETALKQKDFGQFYLVWEALEERAHMMKSAPFMSKPLPIVTPIYKYWEVPYYWAGIKAYDWISRIVTCFDSGMPNSYFASKSNTKFVFPLLREEGLKGSIIYYDGQQNDSRMNVCLALTATIDEYIPNFKGAAVANHCRVEGVLKDDGGHACGVSVEDKLSKERFEVRGKVIVNCTGPFGDEIRKMADPNCKPLLSPAAGVHLVMPRWYTSPTYGMIIPQTTDNRVLFCLPWEDSSVVGTTDSKSNLTHSPAPTTTEVNFIVKEMSRYMTVTEEEVKRDIKAAWSGLRPLVKDPKAVDDGSTAKLSRTHEIVIDKSGLVSVLGGKWTTYRRMAQDTVDTILSVESDKVKALFPCRTKQLMLVGANDHTGGFKSQDCHSVGGRLPLVLHQRYPALSMQQAEHLARNYGFRAIDVCELGVKEGLLAPLVLGSEYAYLKAEIPYVIRNEMARTVPDVLGRRLRLSFVDSEQAAKVTDDVVAVMTKELKWTRDQAAAAKTEAHEFLKTMRYTV